MTPLVIIFFVVFVAGPLAFLLLLRLAPSKRRPIGLVVFGRWLDRNERLFALPVRWVGAGRLLHLGRDWIHLGGVDRGDCFLGAAISPT